MGIAHPRKSEEAAPLLTYTDVSTQTGPVVDRHTTSINALFRLERNIMQQQHELIAIQAQAVAIIIELTNNLLLNCVSQTCSHV